ncbi:hypothetical protein TREMEDRAFT_58045 [Tremella mesenterica DSM 1558]|uniref:uncharacterized protein n=1 Tax=Tremella mesenterica (strain ATCC 24925 / CBS 8224 / DSM 1558 / NBRC 9311 / NRRL Y-6157 / RJB 2259-6 / UBC 559-6) TaxID=578456 RepID=UPI0003F4A059|nr:uncharacterized protein TREMEDRAFT_58045 [Tremella mesenterica DSM 1558]EIW71911.1 hypothetical protein TREMEDRAFT_58045 [Tremella mesenterica DSM 1558]
MSPVPNDLCSSLSFTLTEHVNLPEQTESDPTQTVDNTYIQNSTLQSTTFMPESIDEDLPVMSKFEQPTKPITTQIKSYSSELEEDMSNEEISNFENDKTKDVDIETLDLLSVFEKPHKDRKISRKVRDFVEVGRYSVGYENDFTHDFSLVNGEKYSYITTTHFGELAAQRGHKCVQWQGKWTRKSAIFTRVDGDTISGDPITLPLNCFDDNPEDHKDDYDIQI